VIVRGRSPPATSESAFVVEQRGAEPGDARPYRGGDGERDLAKAYELAPTRLMAAEVVSIAEWYGTPLDPTPCISVDSTCWQR